MDKTPDVFTLRSGTQGLIHIVSAGKRNSRTGEHVRVCCIEVFASVCACVCECVCACTRACMCLVRAASDLFLSTGAESMARSSTDRSPSMLG